MLNESGLLGGSSFPESVDTSASLWEVRLHDQSFKKQRWKSEYDLFAVKI